MQYNTYNIQIQYTNTIGIKKDYCVCHLATGDMLRAAVSSGTVGGANATTWIEKAKCNNTNFLYCKHKLYAFSCLI